MIKEKITDAYKALLFRRYDDIGSVYYYSEKDFNGLGKERFDFVTSRKNRLSGYFYSYPHPVEGKLVIFDHGLGGGHRSYMKEIETLCRHGFTVYAYDHTGCMESEGESVNGLCQSLADLDDCVSAIRENERFKDAELSVIGHSWGGFACGNICAFHSDISRIVVISGFVSAQKIAEQNLRGILSFFRKDVAEIEKEANPAYFSSRADEALLKTDAKTLLIYSSDDKIVKKKYHFDVLKKALSGKRNIRFMLVNGKGHNPNYTYEAVALLKDFQTELKRQSKKGLLRTAEQKEKFRSSFDWDRITEQDEIVWKEIFQILDE